MSIKLFNLVPVVNKLDSSRTISDIECFCYSNSILFIGTSDGQLLRYSVNRSKYLGEYIGFKSEIIDSKSLKEKKPINQISYISEIQKVLVLSDGIMSQLNFHDLEPSGSFRIKNVTHYCLNEKFKENSHSFGLDKSLLCVCIKGRQLQLYIIENNNISLFREINLNEYCIQMELNKNHICVACDNSYLVIDMNTLSIQRLFNYEIETLTPYIVNHIEGEFLLNCQGNLGMFAHYEGKTTRQPITWCENCIKFQISAPYVLCATNDSIKVYNLSDSKLKQEIEFTQIRSMTYIEDENIIFVSTSTLVCALNPVSPSSQINQLLENKRVDEALELFDLLHKKISISEYEEKFKNLKKRCGLIETLENKDYSKGLNLFLESNIDYRQLTKLVYPDLGIAIDEDLVDYFEKFTKTDYNNKMILTNVAALLIEFMIKSKPIIRNQDYVNLLFKLCTEFKPEQLSRVEFFNQLPLQYCLPNIPLLKSFNLSHSTALIYRLSNQNEEAFAIWKDLCDGVLVDEYFPGFDYVIEQFSQLKDYQLLWNNLDWVMSKDRIKGVRIFTQRPKDELTSERMRPDLIIDYLTNYKEALTLYLEYLIYEKNIKKEKYNNQLINVYLETVIGLIKQQDSSNKAELESSRSKLQHLLQNSTNYRVQAVLGKIKEYENHLQKECAILYGKIEEHEKALKILVYTLQDYKAATDYCLNNSKDAKHRKHLFHILFSLYMNPSYQNEEKLLMPCLNLLNGPFSSHFDIPKLIDLIPNNWSIKLTSRFLENVLQANLARKHSVLVKKNICSSHKFALQKCMHSLRQVQLYVDGDECFKCSKPLDSCVFIRQPNGKLCHTSCKDTLRK